MTVVEMIEALQSEWRKTSKIPNCNSFEEGYAKAHEWLARELAPILAAAREQEKELAALRELMECGHPRSVWISDMAVNEHIYRGDGVEEFRGHCSVCQQHDGDLREVAIKTVNWTERIYGVLQCKVDRQKAADSIVREFREKQHRETVCQVHGKHLCAECFPLERKAVIHSMTCAKQETGLQCTCGAEKKAEVGK